MKLKNRISQKLLIVQKKIRNNYEVYTNANVFIYLNMINRQNTANLAYNIHFIKIYNFHFK
jgi:arginine utilization protein RocB